MEMLRGLKARANNSAARARERMEDPAVIADPTKFKASKAAMKSAELEALSLDYEIGKVVL